jgi:hypothetical protein
VSRASYAAYLSLAGQVIPVLLLAILVDAARGAESLTWNPNRKDLSKVAARRSRRVILAIIAGGAGEVVCMGNLAGVWPDPNVRVGATATFIMYSTLLIVIALLYVLLMPHLEYHSSIIYTQKNTYRAWYAWGWIGVIAIFAVGAGLWISNRLDCRGRGCAGDEWVNSYLSYSMLLLAVFAAGILVAIWAARRIERSDMKNDSM